MIIQTFDEKQTLIDREIIKLDVRLRTKRALQAFAVGLLAATISILVPVLHFVLVPGFLIFSFFAAFTKFNEKWAADVTSAKCPNCAHPLTDKMVHLKTLPGRLHCYECRSQLQILSSLKNW